ncbi:hypothetical protein [Enterovibrio nigricans]|uniref:Bacteriophage holin family HP1 n=1 Tax=Enterovibrio nigricans DSM 22720 TaxID=1121868 RepID=A0A1T4UV76_9GAMM|nr:hypothetical protein [Enterovibrio nigricans]PKF50913.1 hypothetical protein AT251_07790 [Enterovibrio nigricans]SKA56592.1 hypothetical protein SAMN02745132_02594 [Enterovibrio nigricans DSM 22720]
MSMELKPISLLGASITSAITSFTVVEVGQMIAIIISIATGIAAFRYYWLSGHTAKLTNEKLKRESGEL